MHRELGEQFLVTRMEIAPISFLPAHRRINSQECMAENARRITLASVIGSRRAMVKTYPKTEEIFLCCSNSSYLPFTRPMTGLNMQQLNTNQAASSVPCKKKRLNFTFLGNNVNTSTITSCFQCNLNQGAIQFCQAFVNMWLTFSSVWRGLERGFAGFNICLVCRGDELLPRSLSSSGFKSRAEPWALNSASMKQARHWSLTWMDTRV